MKFEPTSELFAYNALDLHTTLLAFRKLTEHGAQALSLFDHAMNGPALTMSLRGLRVDERAASQVLEETWQEVRLLRKRADALHRFTWSPTTMKPKPHELARALYDELKAPLQTNREGGRTVSKDALEAIINSPRSSEEASALAALAFELSRLEEDRKVLMKPRGRDGRMHTGFGVASTVTSRWSSRRDAFNEGANLHALSRRVRRIFTADPGHLLVNRDLAQAESFCVSFLAACAAYKRAHQEGNVHFHVLQKLWPGVAETKDIAKKKPVPYNPDMTWYDQAKRIQHACLTAEHEVLTPAGWARVDACCRQAAKSEIAVWHEDGRLTWETPKRWTAVQRRTQNIISFVGRNVSQRVTEDHRLPVFSEKSGKLYTRITGAFSFLHGKLPISGTLECAESADAPGIASARLLAATWADGHLTKDGRYTVWSFKKERKTKRLIKLLNAAGVDWWRSGKKQKPVARILARGHLPKALTWGLLRWPLAVRKAFLAELPFWDGVVRRHRVCNTDRNALEIIQAVAHVSGMSGHIIKDGNPRTRKSKQPWQMHLRTATTTRLRLPTSAKKLRCAVYCPTVSTGWFLVRHNGLISVTGNSNYGQSPIGFARTAHVPVAEAKKAQAVYFSEFSEIKDWHASVKDQLQRFKRLTTPMGRVRQFLGRTHDDSALKEAIAHVPQSTVSDINKIILFRIWQQLDPRLCKMLLEVHDSTLAQVREADVEEFVALTDALSKVEVPINGDTMVIGSTVGIGRNWGGFDAKTNPEGLKE